jgi:hypothetical protein
LPITATVGEGAAMARQCEICSTLPTVATKPRRRLSRLIVGERVVSLCEEHGAHVTARRPMTLSELRSLFIEPDGRRSLLERRQPDDRRAFPARPEGRRRGAGRRAQDVR